MHRNSKVVLILSFCLITTAVLAAGRCVPCKLNHYCVDGLRYQCPSTAPVTQGTGAGALNECLTCTQRNGNSANPIYDDLVGDCVSCYEYDSSTPYWDGTTCSTCPSNTAWDNSSLSCTEVNIGSCIEISTPEQLQNMEDGKNYCLVNNISLKDFEWEPLYVSNIILDGQGYAITDLYLNRPDESGFGFFVAIDNSTIKNLTLKGEVIGSDNIGILANNVYDSTLSNISVEGDITGTNFIALFAYSTNNTTITNSYTKGTVTPTESVGAGFVVAIYDDTTISNSYANIECNPGENSFCAGFIGGIDAENVTVTNCYAQGSINGQGVGFVANHYNGNISNCYTTTAISNIENIEAGFVFGSAPDLINNSFFAEATNTTQADPEGSYETVLYKTTAEMQTPSTFIDAGWDTSIWELVQGQYPKLKGVGGQD